ncbi:hypothetical protein HK102_000639 [Quaeritorhiza haematococci]|nr:hypothetical protein HK102_000639 [Quaeritorhiza haematococci]
MQRLLNQDTLKVTPSKELHLQDSALCSQWCPFQDLLALGLSDGGVAVVGASTKGPRGAGGMVIEQVVEEGHMMGTLSLQWFPEQIGGTGLFATGGQDGKIRLWRVTRTTPESASGTNVTLAPLCTAKAKSSWVSNLVWVSPLLSVPRATSSTRVSYLASSAGKYIQIWQVEVTPDNAELEVQIHLEYTSTPDENTSTITAMSWSQPFQCLFATSYATIHIYDFVAAIPQAQLALKQEKGADAGTTAVTIDWEKALKYDMLEDKGSYVTLATSQTACILAAGMQDAMLMLFAMMEKCTSPEKNTLLENNKKASTKKIVVARVCKSFDKMGEWDAKVFKATNFLEQMQLAGYAEKVNTAEIDPSGQFLATAGSPQPVVWDFGPKLVNMNYFIKPNTKNAKSNASLGRTRGPRQRYCLGHRHLIQSLSFQPTRNGTSLLATCDRNGQVNLYNLKDEERTIDKSAVSARRGPQQEEEDDGALHMPVAMYLPPKKRKKTAAGGSDDEEDEGAEEAEALQVRWSAGGEVLSCTYSNGVVRFFVVPAMN